MLKRILIATALVAVSSPAAFAMSEADCTALWNRADVYSSGKLSPSYTQAAIKSGRSIPADGTVDQATFLDACKADAFKLVAMPVDPGAPLPGANSFTEAQATDRIEKAGFAAVVGLKKDDQGIWRGTATQGGKAVTVALDFKGNVVAK